jgi:hypothetical protein
MEKILEEGRATATLAFTTMDWRTLAQTNLPTVNPQVTSSSYRRPTNPSSYQYGQEDTVGGVVGGPSSAAAGSGPVVVVPPLETALEQYEQSMLEFILNKAQEDTRKSTDRLIQDHVRKHWEMQRDRWMYGLSHHSTAPPPNDHPEDDDDPYYFGRGRGGQLQQGGNSNALTIHHTGAVSSSHDPHYDKHGDRPLLDANQVRDHYSLVRKVLVSGIRRLPTSTSTMSAAARTMVEEFTNLAAVQTTSSSSSLELHLVGQPPHSSAHEYVSAWKIIARLMDGGNSISSSSPVERARLTALALGQRYREHMMMRLGQLQQPPSAASPVGRNNNNDLKQQAVEFQNTFVMGDPSIWPALYFCLRVGDAQAAIALIEQQRGSGLDVDPAVVSLLHVLATCQGSVADSVWEKNLDYLFFDRHQVVAVLDLLETMTGNPHHNKYEAGVYSLLAGATPVLSETLEGLMTTEDYSYTSICIVLLHAADPSEGLADLGKEIIQQGPAYFRTASPWEYFLPLLAAQQYHRALDWLVRVAPVHGTHLALGFHQANIAIQNLGEANVSEQALTAILVKYAALMEYPEAALTYLSLIADKGRARTEMARIVANQDDLTPVAGMMIATDGKRVGGVLEELVSSREEVSEILLAAAALLRVQQGSKKNIILCQMQAERFDEVLATLNSFLVPVDQPDAERGFWVDNTRFFLRDYVDIVSSPVVQNLAKANKLGILEESRLLVQLNDLMAGRQSNKNLADSVELLLPRSQDEFDDKKRRFDDFSAAVQSAYGPFLMLRLRTLADEHADLKRQLIGYNKDAARQNIQHNEQLSDLYIRFAKAINLPGKERHAIIQLGSTIS